MRENLFLRRVINRPFIRWPDRRGMKHFAAVLFVALLTSVGGADSMVWISAGDTYFHGDGCAELAKNKFRVAESKAAERGLRPCPVCSGSSATVDIGPRTSDIQDPQEKKQSMLEASLEITRKRAKERQERKERQEALLREAALSNTKVRGSTEFAFDLYWKLAEKPGNLFFSPLSISSTMAMAYAGARGETAKEMARVLHFPEDQEKLHAAMSEITRTLNTKSDSYELALASDLWGQKDYEFLAPFLSTVERHYGASLHQVDFLSDFEGARRTINTWVEEQTKERIKDLLQPGVLSTYTRLVLTNAIYFKGRWEYQFDESDTKNKEFRITRSESVRVPMMHMTEELRYIRTDDYQAIELPYRAKALSMIIVLPRETDGLEGLRGTLTAFELELCINNMVKQEVSVYLPRFEMTAELNLKTALEEMGMPSAFDPEVADFSGMTDEERLFIWEVIHKAYVNVNEEGTEAAAATAILIPSYDGESDQEVFHADHPFMFVIRDKSSAGILFAGRLANPEE